MHTFANTYIIKSNILGHVESILKLAKETIDVESRAIANLSNLLDINFSNVVELIYNSNGRVVITGIGKSAIIASKIVATLNSTGTPSIFMHAADAIHGDLGLIQNNDIVICISKSGNTPEIKVLVPLIKKANNKLVGITGNTDSFLGTNADFTLNTYVEKEACPNNLAPTTSTTAQLVMGDALAVCLLKLKEFTSSDFAKYHPGGALGKKLYLRVGDLSSQNEIPKVSPDCNVKEIINEISVKRLGTTAVVENDKIIGIITDGDIRRTLSENENFLLLKAKDIMSSSPKSIDEQAMAVEAKNIMDTNKVSQLLVTKNGNYSGVIHIHDLNKEGIL